MHSARYTTYLLSAEWKEFRRQVLRERDFVCEECGEFGDYSTLEVHHLHYDTLGHESDADVRALCHWCHERADEARREETRERAQARLYYARLRGWAKKVYGENWESWPGYHEAADAFDRWLIRKGYA